MLGLLYAVINLLIQRFVPHGTVIALNVGVVSCVIIRPLSEEFRLLFC